jgi:TolB protein
LKTCALDEKKNIMVEKEKRRMISSSNKDALGLFDSQSEVGKVARQGTCHFDSKCQAYKIAGAGEINQGEQDAFHFVWKRLRGNFIVTMRAAWSSAGDNPKRELGWMARASLESDSPFVSTGIQDNGRPVLKSRRTRGGPTEKVRAALSGADVFQLERKGDRYIMSEARYGEPFVSVQISGIDLGEAVHVGLVVSSHEEAILEQAEFEAVRIVKPVKEDFTRGRDPFGSHLELLELASGHRKIIYSSNEIFEAPNWTRDGWALVYNQDGRLFRFDLATRTSRLIETGGIVKNNNDHVLSFDGKMLAISSHDGEENDSLVYTVPLKGGHPKLVTLKGPSYLHGWSPDGKFLVYTAWRNGQFDIYRIPVAGGKEEQLTDTPGLDDGPEYTPDGRYIYFNSVRSGRMQIWRMHPDGSHPEQMTDDAFNNWFPHISPDGKSCVFLSYLEGEAEPSDHPPARRVYLRLMPLDGGVPKVLAYLYGGQGTMNVPSWSPDGRRLAFVSNTVPEE